MDLHFINAKIYTDGQFTNGELWVSNGSITNTPQKNAVVINVNDNFLLPGFIDLQINGAFGYDFTTNPDAIPLVSTKLAAFGVTSFLATVISSSKETYHSILPQIQKYIGNPCGAELLGIHLEGPCFNPIQAKAHDSSLIRNCNDFSSPEDCYGSLHGVKIVTLAPEIPGANVWIEQLSANGIIVSAGHTMASTEQMEEAIAKGVKMATHLFNAMGPLHHRTPGVVGAVLTKNKFFYSLIADGVHLDPHILKLAWLAQPDGLVLVSDSVAAAGTLGGEFSLGSVDISFHNGAIRSKNSNVLAGCAYGLNTLINIFCKCSGAPFNDAIKAATVIPAQILGVYPRKGSLSAGSDADIVIMDKEHKLIACYARGVNQKIH